MWGGGWGGFKGEHWWRTIITEVKVKGKTKTSAFSVFENFALLKRNQPPNIKNYYFILLACSLDVHCSQF